MEDGRKQQIVAVIKLFIFLHAASAGLSAPQVQSVFGYMSTDPIGLALVKLWHLAEHINEIEGQIREEAERKQKFALRYPSVIIRAIPSMPQLDDFDGCHARISKLRDKHYRDAQEDFSHRDEEDIWFHQNDPELTMKSFPCYCMKCNKLKYEDIMECLNDVRQKLTETDGFWGKEVGPELRALLEEPLKK
jgi:hypothetical protein